MKFLRLFIPTIILIFHSLSSWAVLKGDDMNETVIMLDSELESVLKFTDAATLEFYKSRDAYKKEMQAIRQDLASAKLSLFSQQETYIFGNAYASEVALDACAKFHKKKLPIDTWKTTYQRAIYRCKNLQKTLTEINPDDLNDVARSSRADGLKRLDAVLNEMYGLRDSIKTDLVRYDSIVAEVKSFESEINHNYKYILNTLLLKPNKQPTHKVFGSEFKSHWDACMTTLTSMVTSSDYYGWEFQDKWDSETYFIILSGVIAFIIGVLLGAFVIIRFLPKDWEQIHKFSKIFYTLCGWVAVAITYFVIKSAFTDNPFFVSVLSLAVEMCLMCSFLNLSVLLRVRGNQLIPTLLSYFPTIGMSLVIILYRIALIDIYVVRVTYPIILLLVIIAQVCVVLFLHKKLLNIDKGVSYAAVAIFVTCFAMTFFGYYYLSIHVALAWSMFILGHLLLSCYFNYLERCERYWRQKDEEAYLRSWRPFTFKRLLKPMALIIVFSLCTLECAHVFNINEWLNEFFTYDFIDCPGITCISAKRIYNIVIYAILTHFFVGLVNYLLRVKYKEKADVGALNLGRNIFAIIVWCIFIVVALAYIEVNSIGIIATLGGLAVGLGVALRDTFDCLLCGIILMMGRIKIGDVVEVGNDIRGKVVDIQYRTTLIETDDGANISVFNTQFFGKDFRNVSYSGKYQRLHLSFKVQKEIDAPKVREMLAQALIDGVPELAKSPAPKILFGASDRFHVDMIAQVWVPVMDYYEAISNVKETLFNTLKAHGMSNMSVDSRVRIIKNIVEDTSADDNKK